MNFSIFTLRSTMVPSTEDSLRLTATKADFLHRTPHSIERLSASEAAAAALAASEPLALSPLSRSLMTAFAAICATWGHSAFSLS